MKRIVSTGIEISGPGSNRDLGPDSRYCAMAIPIRRKCDHSLRLAPTIRIRIMVSIRWRRNVRSSGVPESPSPISTATVCRTWQRWTDSGGRQHYLHSIRLSPMPPRNHNSFDYEGTGPCGSSMVVQSMIVLSGEAATGVNRCERLTGIVTDVSI